MIKFIDYLNSYWMEKWPLDIWTCCMQKVTTNNNSEVFHSSLNSRIGRSKPTFNKLFYKWMKTEEREMKRLEK